MQTFPLPLRNALAELAIRALDEPDATAALRWLTTPSAAPTSGARVHLDEGHLIAGDGLAPVYAAHAEAIAAHAARALSAVGAHQPAPPGHRVERAARATIALWNERLFFEVHEVLEAVWKTATGPSRQVLQGVIQIAVAYHHLAHGNLRGARTLITEGRARVASAREERIDPIDLDELLAATAAWEAALKHGTTPPAAPPRLGVRR